MYLWKSNIIKELVLSLHFYKHMPKHTHTQ